MVEKSNHHNGRNVWAFFLLTFSYSWLLWLPFVLAGIGIVKYTDTLTSLRLFIVPLGAFSPLLSAVTLIARRHGWAEVKKYVLQVFDLRIKARYYILAFLVPLIVTAVAHYTANFTGIDNLPRTLLPENLSTPMIILLAVPVFLAMFIAGGGQEEFGWRGYAQEPLQERFGVIGGSIVLGVVWGLWHFPLWLMGDEHSYYPFLAFVFFTIGQSIILACLYNASGKKLIIPMIIHAMSNTAAPLFPITHMEKVPQPGYWMWAGTTALTALCLTVWFYKKIEVHSQGVWRQNEC